MPQSNVTIRPSANSVRPAGAGKAGASGGSRFHRGDTSREELELPLAPSPPISVASARSAAPISGVSLRVHSDLEEIRDEWKAFERQADRTVFQTFDWLADWQREIGARNGTIPAIVLGIVRL
jgi:hypothetical protein